LKIFKRNTQTQKSKKDDPRKKWKKRKEVKNRLKVEKKVKRDADVVVRRDISHSLLTFVGSDKRCLTKKKNACHCVQTEVLQGFFSPVKNRHLSLSTSVAFLGRTDFHSFSALCSVESSVENLVDLVA
jgi:hypothetical protein